MGNGFGIALAGMWLLSQAAPAPTPPPEPRYYLIQVRIIEVDEQGKQTVVATPSLQTTGDATGVTVDPKRGRKFEFHFSAIDPNAPSVVSTGDEPTGKPIVTADGMKIEKNPPARVTLKAVQQTRKEILKAIVDQAGMQLMLDADTVAATAAPLLTPISLELQNTPVEDAIRQIVEPAKLNFAVRQDLVLIGATPLRPAPTKTAAAGPILAPPSTLPAGNPKPLEVPANSNALSVRVYAVQDLVKIDATTQRPEFKSLIEQIQKAVSTDSWDNQGGMATIRGFDSTVSLVVRQTAAGHDAVAKFLDERRAKTTTPAP